MIRSYVYFHGPMTAWQGWPHPEEAVAQFESRWQWLALVRARAAWRVLNGGRCGYVVETEAGEILAHEKAPLPLVATA